MGAEETTVSQSGNSSNDNSCGYRGWLIGNIVARLTRRHAYQWTLSYGNARSRQHQNTRLFIKPVNPPRLNSLPSCQGVSP